VKSTWLAGFATTAIARFRDGLRQFTRVADPLLMRLSIALIRVEFIRLGVNLGIPAKGFREGVPSKSAGFSMQFGSFPTRLGKQPRLGTLPRLGTPWMRLVHQRLLNPRMGLCFG
jgi:hypothetical protein